MKEVTKSFFEKTNHQMNDEEVELLKKSLAFRGEKVKDAKWGGNIFSQSEVLGMYLVALNNGDKKEDYFVVVVSNHPMQILGRTIVSGKLFLRTDRPNILERPVST